MLGEFYIGTGPARFLVGECCVAVALPVCPVVGVSSPIGAAGRLCVSQPTRAHRASPVPPVLTRSLRTSVARCFAISHAIPPRPFQILKSDRWNCNVFRLR